jgi:hypothetical protein
MVNDFLYLKLSKKNFNNFLNIKNKFCSPYGWYTENMLTHELNLYKEFSYQEIYLIIKNNLYIGYYEISLPYWASGKDIIDSTIVLPENNNNIDIYQNVLDKQIQYAKKNKYATLRAWDFSGSKFKRKFYESNNFSIGLEEIESILHLDHVSFSSNEEIKIKTLNELKTTDNDYKQKLFTLWSTVTDDVPKDLTGIINTNRLLEKTIFTKWFNDNHTFIAIEDNKWIGLISYMDSEINSDTIITNLSGVLKKYRNKGICTYLKNYSLDILKKKNFKKIITWNEKDNSILSLNKKLGFAQSSKERSFLLKIS